MQWTAFPNPATDVLWIEAVAEHAETCTLQAFSITGQKIREQEMQVGPGLNRIPMDIQSLPTGLYVIRIKGFASAIKVLVQ